MSTRFRGTAILLSVTVAAALLGISPSAQTATLPASAGRIIFDGAGIGLQTVNPDGSVLTTLTGTVAADNNPGWAPNGQFVVFDNGGDIFRANPDGSGRTLLTPPVGGADSEPQVDPTNTKIVFERTAVGIVEMPATGGAVTTVTGTIATDQDPDYSPNGQFVVFHNGATGILRLNADGSGGRTTLAGTAAGDSEAIVTADGATVLFDTAAGIFSLPFPNGGPRLVFTGSVAADDHAAPNPNGSTVVYDRAGALVSVPLPSGGAVTTIVAAGADEPHFGPGAPPPSNVPPTFTAPGCGSTILVPALGSATLSATIAVRAIDSNAGQSVTLTAAGLPSWATFSSAPGNPATGSVNATPSIFDWLSGLLGGAGTTVTFTASDNGSPAQSATCTASLRIRLFAGSPI